MLRYDIARLASRPKGTLATIPGIEERAGTVRDYTAILRRMLREIAREVREGVIPQMQAEMAVRSAMVQRDAPSDWFARLDAMIAGLQRTASDMVNRLLRLEAERHSDEFMRVAKRVLGVDLAAVVRQEDLTDYLDAVALRNAALIKGLSEDTVKRVKQRAIEAVLAGQSTKALRRTLADEFGIMGRRAELIARDQTAKLTSDLNRIRQQQAGIDEYRWRTSRDERVRERHRQLEGTKYKWGESTGAEGGLPPGQPIQCRCTAEGVVQF